MFSETRNSEALKQVRKIIALGSLVLILNFVRATISRINITSQLSPPAGFLRRHVICTNADGLTCVYLSFYRSED